MRGLCSGSGLEGKNAMLSSWFNGRKTRRGSVSSRITRQKVNAQLARASSNVVETLEDRKLMAATLPNGFTEALVVGGLSQPTDLAYLPDGRILVTQKSGALRVIKNGSVLSTPAMTLQVDTFGDRGFNAIELDPNFSVNRHFYVVYATRDAANPNNPPNNSVGRLSRFTMAATGDRVETGSELVLLDGIPIFTGFHMGGFLGFGADGMLYIGTGDGGATSDSLNSGIAVYSQDLSRLDGKVLRVNARDPQNLIPADNPWVNTPGARGEVWAIGFRNAFSGAFEPGTSDLYINDVQQDLVEEINFIIKGANYGWNQSEGFSTNPEYTNPVYTYDHDGLRSSPTGGVFYDGNLFPGSYKGLYFFGDYQRGFIRALDVNTGTAIDFATNVDQGLVRMDVRPDGAIYYLSYDRGGIYKINYTGSANRPPTVEAAANKTSGPVGLNVSFSAAGTEDPDSDPISYLWDFGNGQTAPGFTASHVYTAAGTYYAKLIASDNRGMSTTSQSIMITVGNSAPVIDITTNVAKYVAGAPLTFTGNAIDLEDGVLPANSFQWDLDFFHKGHFSDITTYSGVKTGSFDLPRFGDTSTDQFYRITLTVTDSAGLSYTTHTDVLPQMANITLAANVGGATLGLDLLNYNNGSSVIAVAGMTRTLVAPPTQTINGITYNFVGWSDNGTATHNINAPAEDTVYLAFYSDTAPTEAQGLNASYFSNSALSGSPTLTRVDQTVNFNWATGQPDPSIPGDNFSVRWTGKVKAQFTERYTFYTSSDDGIRLWVNGVQLINNWTDHAESENSGSINLVAGQSYDIRLEYYEKGGGAVAKLSWASTSTPKQIIPVSALFSGATRAVSAAPVVTGISASSNGRSVTITWRDMSPNETGFVVQRKGPGEANFVDYATVGANVQTYTDGSTLTGSAYTYRVRGTNSSGASIQSQAVSITTPIAPQAPTGLTFEMTSATSVQIGWTDNASNETKFVIERKVGNGSFVKLADLNANATTFTDTSLAAGTTYTYRIFAGNAVGDSSATEQTFVVPTPVASPSGTAANATGSNSVAVTIGSANGASGFRVEVSTDGGTNYHVLANVPPSALVYTHATATASTTYHYRVTALGQYTWLNSTPVIVTATTPAAPATGGTTLRVNAGGNAYIDSQGNSWLNTAGFFTGGTSTNYNVAVANTVDDTIYGARRIGADFRFLATVENGTYTLNLHFMEPTHSAAGKRKFNVHAHGQAILSNFDIATESGGINRALLKTFTIVVTDGKLDLRFTKGLADAVVSGIELIPLGNTPVQPPTSPSDLVGAPTSSTSVQLSWVDNASNETGYRVERSTDGISYTTVATLPANSTSHTDVGLTASRSYHYRIVAAGTAGDSTASNTITVNTPAAPVAGGTTIRTNAGNGSIIDMNGNAWSPVGSFSSNSTVSTSTVAINGTTDDALYYLRRWGKDFTYTTDATNGTYTLRLHFAEPTMTASNKRVFSVQAEGQTILNNFDIHKEAGAKTALVKTFTITITDGKLDLRLFASIDNAVISAIELIPAEGGVTPTPTPPAAATGLIVTNVGSGSVAIQWTDNSPDETGYLVERSTDGVNFTPATTLLASATTWTDTGRNASTTYHYRVVAMGVQVNAAASNIVTATTLATPPAGGTTLRVNAGGNAYMDSTGNSWVNTAGYFTGGNSTNLPTAIANTVDDPLYYSRRLGKEFTFNANVANGTYTLKLHFADPTFAAGKRKMSVWAEGQQILSDFDITAEAGGKNSALVKTFTVTVTDGSLDLRFLGTLEFAVVNGVELMPLS